MIKEDKKTIRIIRFYQKNISPRLPRMCKYQPTCSEYAIEAFSEYNPIKAGFITAKRICRCNPFSEGGYDPLKKKKT